MCNLHLYIQSPPVPGALIWPDQKTTPPNETTLEYKTNALVNVVRTVSSQSQCRTQGAPLFEYSTETVVRAADLTLTSMERRS